MLKLVEPAIPVPGFTIPMHHYPTPKKPNTGNNKRCKHASGCSKTAKTGGLCISHGGGRKCSEAGCTKLAQIRGRCALHGGGCQHPDGCSKFARKGGLCRAHGNENQNQIHGMSHSAWSKFIGHLGSAVKKEPCNTPKAPAVSTPRTLKRATLPAERTSANPTAQTAADAASQRGANPVAQRGANPVAQRGANLPSKQVTSSKTLTHATAEPPLSKDILFKNDAFPMDFVQAIVSRSLSDTTNDMSTVNVELENSWFLPQLDIELPDARSLKRERSAPSGQHNSFKIRVLENSLFAELGRQLGYPGMVRGGEPDDEARLGILSTAIRFVKKRVRVVDSAATDDVLRELGLD